MLRQPGSGAATTTRTRRWFSGPPCTTGLGTVRRVTTVVVACWLALSGVATVLAGTFRDDFEDGDLDGWTALVAPAGLWELVDGGVQCERRSGVSAILIVGDAGWSDYTIDYDILLLESHGAADLDVIARFGGWWTSLYLFGVGDVDGGAFVYRAPGGKQASEPLPAPALDAWHHVRLDAQGDQFTLSLNGEEVLRYTDDAIPTGGVGIGQANYTARFDNVEITGPEVPDVTPPTWSPRVVSPAAGLATTWGRMKSGE